MLRYLEALHGTGTLAGLTDQQLLERFLEADRAADGPGGEAAFEAILERHGPLVWRVCRSLLADDHDAEDAFQATFLILVREVHSLRLRATLGAWLHTVARRTALGARAAAARRRAAERAAEARRLEAGTAGYAGPGVALEEDELDAMVHSEVEKLPGSFRAVIVLCDLEGLSYLEAARRLELPLGTVQSRLARARRRLHRGLAGRGLAPPSPPGPCEPPRVAMPAAAALRGLPGPLARRTCQIALSVASNPAGSRLVVADSVRALIEGGSRRMSPFTPGGVVLAGMSGLVLCAAMARPHPGPGQPPREPSPGKAAPASAPAEGRTPERRPIEPPTPRKLKATAGRGGVLTYALGEDGARLPVRRDAPDGLVREEVRDLRWVVVTGIIDHRRVQDGFRKGGDATPPVAADAYRRGDLERQVLREDGTWSPWEPIDLEAKLQVLDNLPEVGEERVPGRLRVDALIDPLPFLKTGAWKGVDAEALAPPRDPQAPARAATPDGRRLPTGDIAGEDREHPSGVTAQGEGMMGGPMAHAYGGMMGGNAAMSGMMRGMMGGPMGRPPQPDPEPPVLMLRQFDFAVEPGRTYRYRARVVLNDGRRRADRPGAWSEPTEPVATPPE
ncbi:ECF RNA polymerase sigma factor SigE [Aquisphaera giovannonii]|uniref:ECF RNA polymerase sigma factor SigE n=1 Tax=Aquisphaera giovannonii TaxID=406548 RepID=A0A5B9WES2_9BACT|nr:RNA polymerase sigma factor [Aquisphaera giovannonii]QEH39082.1 ECF RNA polymerase sigma factor SigE [Aquisphaera giovannonii]